LRYAGRDYSLPGKYFVTICTAGKKEWFGNVINSKMYLSEIGQIASQMWFEIPVHFPFIVLDAFVVMPNHLHGIIVINGVIGTPIVGALHATPLPNFSWQPGFYDNIICTTGQLKRIRKYLLDNPKNWNDNE
jgi:REP element-mobilizing transposase RayT